MEMVVGSQKKDNFINQEQIIRDYEKMVIAIVRSYHPEENIFADLVQEGILGLLKASERFDESMGNRFSTYATYWIRYYVRRYLSRNMRSIRVPSRKVELYRCVSEIREDCMKCGIDVSDEDVACSVNISVNTLRKIEMCNMPVLSFDLPMGDSETMLYEVVEDTFNVPVEKILIEEELKSHLSEALNILLEKEQQIIKQRFGFDGSETQTLREIADEYGVSAETVRQIEKRAIAKLRTRCAGLGEYLK